MRAKHKRIIIIFIFLIVFLNFMGIIFFRLNNDISFFYTVTEVLAQKSRMEKVVRVGGTVRVGSVLRSKDAISFEIFDENNAIKILYKGILPPIFAENSNVVVKGKVVNDKFLAEDVYSKHDENYIPKKYKSIS